MRVFVRACHVCGFVWSCVCALYAFVYYSVCMSAHMLPSVCMYNCVCECVNVNVLLRELSAAVMLYKYCRGQRCDTTSIDNPLPISTAQPVRVHVCMEYACVTVCVCSWRPPTSTTRKPQVLVRQHCWSWSWYIGPLYWGTCNIAKL